MPADAQCCTSKLISGSQRSLVSVLGGRDVHADGGGPVCNARRRVMIRRAVACAGMVASTL
jgi:hypothetical protein